MPIPPEFANFARRFSEVVPYSNACEMQITDVARGQVEMRLPYRQEWLGDLQRGVIHTGVITSLVDSASGAAVLSSFPQYEPVATIDLRMDYLRPALKDHPVICRAECYRLTRSIAFTRASVWQTDPERPVALSQGVFMRSTRSPGTRS
jgi:uncharacterized protein (TIGR00369 family)